MDDVGGYKGGLVIATTGGHLTQPAGGSQYRVRAGLILYMKKGILLESARFSADSRRGRTIVIRHQYFWVTALAAFLSLTLVCLAPALSEAKQGRTYKVQGTVIAITLSQTPPLIVVKTPLGPRNHMTVGATVTAHTKILRGDKRVALNAIREGEAVWLTYVKTQGGVLAEVILVRA